MKVIERKTSVDVELVGEQQLGFSYRFLNYIAFNTFQECCWVAALEERTRQFPPFGVHVMSCRQLDSLLNVSVSCLAVLRGDVKTRIS